MSEKKIAVIGAGLIGSGIGISAVIHGIPAALRARTKHDLVRKRMEDGISFLEEKGVITKEVADRARGLYTITTVIAEAVEGATLIQECGPDSVEIKRGIIAEIEESADPDAIICTATSSLSITEVFAEAKNPGRCMGGHPYNPSYLIPLIEITKGQNTEDSYVAAAKDFYTEIGKIPVVLNKETIGFIANRYQSAIHREAVDLVENGVCSVEDADKALVYGVGIRWGIMGQFLTMHLGAAPDGIGSFNEKYHVDVTKPDGRLSHMPTWTTFPADWTELAQKGLEEAIAKRDPSTGTDMDSIAAWRDDMLVESLKLHKLL